MAGAFTVPADQFSLDESSGCSTIMAGCSGEIVGFSHDVTGTIEVIDDCTFQVTNWGFDGEGPDVEWWAAA